MLPAPPDGALCGNPGAIVIGQGRRKPEKDFRCVAKPLDGVLHAHLEHPRRSVRPGGHVSPVSLPG